MCGSDSEEKHPRGGDKVEAERKGKVRDTFANEQTGTCSRTLLQWKPRHALLPWRGHKHRTIKL